MTGRSLTLYVLRRMLVLGLLLLVMSFAVFSLLYIAPGDPVEILLGTNPRTPELVRSLRQEYHLDQPFLTQYWIWLEGAAHLDFGNSIQTTLPVRDTITARLPLSLFLGVYAYILTMLMGVVIGIVSALKRGTAVDRGATFGAVFGLSTPAFVAAVFLLYLLAIAVPVFPVFGGGSGFTNRLYHLTLPACALAIHSSAWVAKHTRIAMINVLDQDYVTFARARGLSPGRVLFQYTLRNALIPIVTISALVLAGLIVGAVLVETTFSLPGIGNLLVESATAKDLPMVQGVALLFATVIMLANLIADLAYLAVDPRVRLAGRSA